MDTYPDIFDGQARSRLLRRKKDERPRRTMAVHDYESKCISYINDIEPQTQEGGIGMTRPRKWRMATKTNDQLIEDLVQTSRLIVKQNDPMAPSLDQTRSSPNKHGQESSTIRFLGQSAALDLYPHTDHVTPTDPFPERAQVLLYPDRGQNWYESTMQSAYRGLQGKRPDPAKPFDGFLKPEGEMALDTTSRVDYRSYDLTGIINQTHSKGAARPTVTLPVIPQKGKFCGETQTMRDFPGFGDGQPSPPEPFPPASDNLRVPYHVGRSFETEQRRQFIGIDPVQHPRPKPINSMQRDSIQRSEEPFETMTNHKLDYLPIKDYPQVRRSLPPLHHSTSLIASQDKSRAFDGTTTNQLHFREWPISPPQRHGDFHDELSYGTSGSHPLYRVQSEPKGLPLHGLTKVQATMLLRELRRRKRDRDGSIQKSLIHEVNSTAGID